MGKREYARHRKALKLIGGSLGAVQKALARGRIHADENQRIDSEAADREWALNSNPAKRAFPEVAEPVLIPLLDGQAIDGPSELTRRPDWSDFPELPPIERSRSGAPLSNVVDPGAFLAAKTEREVIEARRARLKLDHEERRLIPAEDARRVLQASAKLVAQGREQLPTQLGPQLVGKTDPQEIARIIREAYRTEDLRSANEIQNKLAELLSADDKHRLSVAL